MRYLALATDYDGTLATHGSVEPPVLEALEKFRRSGRKLIMVTGRELPDLEKVFPHFELFDRIVAENGALVYDPAKREKCALAVPPKRRFVEVLRERGVAPIAVGDVIVATWHPNENIVLDVIRDLGLELHVIFNKGAVMVLPSGVNKMTGLDGALAALGLSEHNVVGIGDAENDHAFLTHCEFAVAVGNALPAVKDTADLTTRGNHGFGVMELIDHVLREDIGVHSLNPVRRNIPVGREGELEVSIPAYGGGVLIAGASGSGKSTLVAGLLESLIERRYQICLIDPEGDYEGFPETIAVGDEKHAPPIEQILQALKKPQSQVAVNLLGMPLEDRPGFCASLLPHLQEMRLRTGRPHWLVIDEAHHLLPAGWVAAEPVAALNNVILITVHPDDLDGGALTAIDVVFAVGPSPENVLRVFGVDASAQLASGEALVWFRETGQVHRVKLAQSHLERQRHRRKYALGELGEDHSFYFRGPRGQLNLRARNLTMFVQMAQGVDDETWSHHLHQGDYSRWFNDAIKDEALAQEVARIEEDRALTPRESRERIKQAIEQRYTAPA